MPNISIIIPNLNSEKFLPHCSEYNRTVIELHLGEEWFCSEKEASKAGYTKSKNCP